MCTRAALAMFSFTMSWMPQATLTGSRPSRPASRSAAARADLEQPDLVHVRDAPASRADLDQLDGRDADGQPAALDEAPLARRFEAVRGERLALVDEGELGRGPPHV